jgi:hypothetical protein
MKSKLQILLFLLFGLFSLNSCSFLFGSKKDKQVDEIFEQGRIDPLLYPNNIGYVPIQPYWTGFSNPVEVYVGYDEMVYVADDNGVTIMDLKGEVKRKISILQPTHIVQDKRIHTYICGRILIDVNADGTKENVAAVFHIRNASASGGPIFVDTIIHPFCDATRSVSAYRGPLDDQVQFSGVAPLFDNTVYIARTGPSNSLATIALPDNSILKFDVNGINTGFCNGLNPINSSLKSTLNISSICTAVAPPQNYEKSNNDFFITQTRADAEYKVLSIKELNDIDAGISYAENSTYLQKDVSKADRFLYDSYKFKSPSDIFKATDAATYLFVVDNVTDSFYQFTAKGFEGVNPPANSVEKKQIIVSFGGPGNGPFQFNKPSAVCYYKKVIYIADKGNNRISRFKLSTDLEN